VKLWRRECSLERAKLWAYLPKMASVDPHGMQFKTLEICINKGHPFFSSSPKSENLWHGKRWKTNKDLATTSKPVGSHCPQGLWKSLLTAPLEIGVVRPMVIHQVAAIPSSPTGFATLKLLICGMCHMDPNA